MAWSEIRIKPTGKNRVEITLIYRGGADDPPADDFHIEWKKDDGPSDWHTWIDQSIAPATYPDADTEEPGGPGEPPHPRGYSFRSNFSVGPDAAPVPGTPPAPGPGDRPPLEDGRYSVRLTWTNSGRPIGTAVTTMNVGGCFIATAAYGSDLAEEVEFLRGLRDNVVRATSWGRDFFDAFWERYYQVSPVIADQMRADPEFKRLMRWAIVEPWLNYIRLLTTQPAWREREHEIEELSPDLRAFVERARDGMRSWLADVNLPKDIGEHDPDEAVRELNVFLDLKPADGLPSLERLVQEGALPLRYEVATKERLTSELRRGGRSEDEIALILVGESKDRGNGQGAS